MTVPYVIGKQQSQSSFAQLERYQPHLSAGQFLQTYGAYLNDIFYTSWFGAGGILPRFSSLLCLSRSPADPGTRDSRGRLRCLVPSRSRLLRLGPHLRFICLLRDGACTSPLAAAWLGRATLSRQSASIASCRNPSSLRLSYCAVRTGFNVCGWADRPSSGNRLSELC